MKKYLQHFMFGTSLNNQTFPNLIWLLFRLHIGLSIAIGAGLPKMKDGLAPIWFVKQVGDLGFTFISPTFWATVASWGEFVGGIALAIGLFTRFNAIQLAFQFFVISFLWYDNPVPVVGMYVQQLFFFCYLLVAAFGGGKFSIDYVIKNMKSLKIGNPKFALIFIFGLLSLSIFAQKKPLKGSGIIITKQFNFTNFNEIEILDFDGVVQVKIGDSFSIYSEVDDNLSDLLSVTLQNNTLKISFKNNWNNRKYIENTKAKIEIVLPKLKYVKNNGNNTLRINHLNEQNFSIICKGNGTCIVQGKVQNLEATCRGNGTLNAKNLIAIQCDVADVMGNGNLSINTDSNFNATVSGNGNITNYGKGKAVVINKIGNGEISYKN